MKTNQITDLLNTMSRTELRRLAIHLNIPRGRNKHDTIANLGNAFSTGTARLKIVFTIKAEPVRGMRFSRPLFMKKIRNYDTDRVLFQVPPVAHPPLTPAE
jgi:hypothetical protein